MQAVRIQPIGRIVRRHYKPDIQVKERGEQPVQDHRIGDIRDVKLVEAYQSVARCDVLCHFIERIFGALQIIEFAMHAAHELVKMHARLANDRHCGEERIHQETLAAADSAPQINAARDWRTRKQLF